MGKLIEYDIKGNYKYYFGLYIIMIVASLLTIFLSKFYNFDFIVVIFVLLALISTIIPYVKIINSFKNELYEDTGYLLFTVPRKSYEVLGAKIVSGLIWITLTSVILSLLGIIVFYALVPYSARMMISSTLSNVIIWNEVPLQIIVISLLGLFKVAFMTLLIYFSIILSKVAIKSKKLGGFISFVAFIVIVNSYIYFTFKLSNTFPQSINLPSVFTNKQIFDGGMHNFMNLEQTITINIAILIENTLLFIGFFIGSSKLIERIDL